MIFLLSEAGLRYDENVIVPGVQTVHQDEGRAGEEICLSARPHRPLYLRNFTY
jgi:hypothetical protein